jgi:hypothetical protein
MKVDDCKYCEFMFMKQEDDEGYCYMFETIPECECMAFVEAHYGELDES